MALNIKASMKDKKTLVLEIDITQTHGESGSKKSIKIASTEGNQSVNSLGEDCKDVPESIKLGLNVYKKKK